jgi:hypothetical protein
MKVIFAQDALSLIEDKGNVKRFKLVFSGSKTRYQQKEDAFDQLEAKYKGFHRLMASTGDDTSSELVIRDY